MVPPAFVCAHAMHLLPRTCSGSWFGCWYSRNTAPGADRSRVVSPCVALAGAAGPPVLLLSCSCNLPTVAVRADGWAGAAPRSHLQCVGKEVGPMRPAAECVQKMPAKRPAPACPHLGALARVTTRGNVCHNPVQPLAIHGVGGVCSRGRVQEWEVQETLPLTLQWSTAQGAEGREGGIQALAACPSSVRSPGGSGSEASSVNRPPSLPPRMCTLGAAAASLGLMSWPFCGGGAGVAGNRLRV